MANQTIQGAFNVRGTNPQFLVDKMVRNKIYGCRYWKEFCTGLTAESIIDEGINLEYVSGCYGGFRNPSKFICLILKLLQIQPEQEIVLEYMRNEEHKYMTALAMFYFRLSGKAVDIYNVLEEFYTDSRKLRYRNEDGSFKIICVDEFVDQLLKEEIMCSTTLPHMKSRILLEEAEQIKPRISQLEKELEEELLAEERQNMIEEQQKKEQEKQDMSRSNSKDKKKSKKKHRKRSRSRSSHRKDKKDKKNKKHWRKVVSGNYRDRSRDRSKSPKKDIKNQQPRNSIERENIQRAALGLQLLPTK